ncbi:MAG TPA: choice-of-anchor Q domain-containing protein [Terriglobales bacterium]|nr:choice-of-anchor Q domain-containing protein [Terriglobales bacterium]
MSVDCRRRIHSFRSREIHSNVIPCFILLIAIIWSASGEASTIFVTTTQQKISSTGGCSLQEAIFSANLDSSQAVAFVDTSGVEHLIPTECVPGSGDDTIVLPTSGVFQMSSIVDDIGNFMGPTATPMISSTVTVEGNGATLQWVNGNLNARAFAVGPGGNLTINEVFITGFIAKGGNGASGGGGGMGAGGAIYVSQGTLTVVNSTFSNNSALGGSGTTTDQSGGGGGGGGIGGNGGSASPPVNSFGGSGGGGGGSRGDGVGSGGGTVFNDIACGGSAGSAGIIFFANGGTGLCPGGGGGGGAGISETVSAREGGDGGKGAYGGGGGGAGEAAFSSSGGNGDFGGGGGAAGFLDNPISSGDGGTGGNGGYGGGGGGANGPGDGHGGIAGKFAGRGDRRHGGGGAALGGAIFSHFGGVLIQNSTFSENHVIRGNAGGGVADNGQDEGGAIFAVGGNLTVQDVTVSGNTSTGEGAGIVVDIGTVTVKTPQGIEIVLTVPTFFTLENTIISNPSARECFFTEGVTANGDGNLIVNNFGCEGMVISTPPLLGPLALNAPGLVPTLALLRSSSDPALNAAAGGLSTDERGFPRPQGPGFDIGAYELCAPKDIFDISCDKPTKPLPPETETLLIQVSPPGSGTTNPIAGSYTEGQNSVIPLSATPNPGYSFVSWTGGVAVPNSTSTTVTMDQSRTITANFVALPTTMFGNIIAKAGPSNARVWTLSLLDNGPGATNTTLITAFTLTQTFGAACTPVVKNSFPVLMGNLAPSQTGTTTVTIDFTGCAASARFTARFNYSANGGAVSGFVSRTNQYQ